MYGIELGAELRVAAPVVDLVGVPHLRARLLGHRDPVGLGPHHSRHGAELDPASEQLGAQGVGADREEPADVRAPGADPRQPHRQSLADRGLKPVEVPHGRGVASPHDARARRGARSTRSAGSARSGGRPRAPLRGRCSGTRAGRGCEPGSRARRGPSASRAACTRRSPPSTRRGRPRSPRRGRSRTPRPRPAG